MTATQSPDFVLSPHKQILSGHISVVMVSFHTGDYLFKAVEAALDDPDIAELILVDNGNHPDFRAKLWAEIQKLKTAKIKTSNEGAKIRLVQGHGNIGFGQACNYGASLARGEYILFLNPDAIIERGAARRLADCGQGLKSPWITGGFLQTRSGAEQRGGRRNAVTPISAIVSFSPLHKLSFFNSLHLENTPKPDHALPMPVVSGAFMMMDQQGMSAVSGFNPKYFLHVEDIDLCKRVRDYDGEVYYVPSAKVMHYGSTSQARLNTVEYNKLKGFIRYFWHYSPKLWAKALLVLSVPAMYLGIMGRAFLISLRQK